jgi:cyanophycinase
VPTDLSNRRTVASLKTDMKFNPLPRLRILLSLTIAMMAQANGLVAAENSSDSSGSERVRPSGALVIAGGGDLGQEVMGKFIALAGGPKALIVVVPTADSADSFHADYKGAKILQAAGARNVKILHTRNRAEADSEAFVKPLRQAHGVWIGGGRQWRLADAYLDTLTERELHALLNRGGVIGGTSAGASIQASYLVRGAPEGNRIMMARGHERGFAFVPNSAIDQHVLARKREGDLATVIQTHPDLLGIGVDEGTAIIVQGERFEVVGKSQVVVYGAHSPPTDGKLCLMLSPGAVFNLKTRRLER